MRLEPAAARAFLARFLIFAAVLLAVEVPLTVAFARPVPLGWLGFCVFLDVLFLVDALLSWRWPTRDEALDDEAAAAQRALSVGRVASLAVAIAAHVPWSAFGFESVLAPLRLLTLLRLQRLAAGWQKLQAMPIARLISMILTFLLCAHWVACLWWLIGRAQLDDATLPRAASWIHRYYGGADDEWGGDALCLFDDDTGDVTVVQPNEDGSYWRKVVRNKMHRMKEMRRVAAAKSEPLRVVDASGADATIATRSGSAATSPSAPRKRSGVLNRATPLSETPPSAAAVFRAPATSWWWPPTV